MNNSHGRVQHDPTRQATANPSTRKLAAILGRVLNRIPKELISMADQCKHKDFTFQGADGSAVIGELQVDWRRDSMEYDQKRRPFRSVRDTKLSINSPTGPHIAPHKVGNTDSHFFAIALMNAEKKIDQIGVISTEIAKQYGIPDRRTAYNNLGSTEEFTTVASEYWDWYYLQGGECVHDADYSNHGYLEKNRVHNENELSQS